MTVLPGPLRSKRRSSRAGSSASATSSSATCREARRRSASSGPSSRPGRTPRSHSSRRNGSRADFRARPGTARPACRSVPRADEAFRRGPPRQRRRGRRPVLRGAQGRDHARDRRRRGGRFRRGGGGGRRLGARRSGRTPASGSRRRGAPGAQPPYTPCSQIVDNTDSAATVANSFSKTTRRPACTPDAPLAAQRSFLLLAVPGARAWSWPAEGEVLSPFVFDPAHPYAGGQHRGIDIAVASGETIVAPAAGRSHSPAAFPAAARR